MLKIKGENYKKNKDGSFGFEVGCDLFCKTGRGDTYKKMDEWWLIETADICYKIKNPFIEKLSANRVKYHFATDREARTYKGRPKQFYTC